MNTHQESVQFIWQIAELLRGVYRPPQYERVMLPLTVLRRFDCVLAPTKDRVVAEYERMTAAGTAEEVMRHKLNHIAGQRFYNTSRLDFAGLKGDPENIAQHLSGYIKGFTPNVREIFEFFKFEDEIITLNETNLLYLVISQFCNVDLHPSSVPNFRMGLIFEDLIRRFNEAANETAGDYFTPREVIRLMVHLLFSEDDALLNVPGTVRKLLDPACGTGGMLSEAQNYMREHHPQAHLYLYGQDYNRRAYAIAASDLLMKEEDPTAQPKNFVRYGDSFLADQFKRDEQGNEMTFDYFLANPPFGVEWKRQQKEIEREAKMGMMGRFGAGLPRISDGALLFLQHMVSKFETPVPEEQKYGSRLAIVFNGSPLFSGGAGSGESDIRKWIIEKDWLEAIIALPEQMFYNTGIGTYIWVLTNHKRAERKGKVQLIDARDKWVPMRKSLGNKRRKLGEGRRVNPISAQVETDDPRDDIATITQEHGAFAAAPTCKIFDNADFGYRRVTIERPLRLRFQISLERKERFLNAVPYLLDDVQALDKELLGREPYCDWNALEERIRVFLHGRKSTWKTPEWRLFRDVFTSRDPAAEPVIKARKGKYVEYEPDTELRDFENVPLKEDVNVYFVREVAPYVPDAWMDMSKDKIGYEINFNRYFYTYKAPDDLAVIDAKLRELEEKIVTGLRDLTAVITSFIPFSPQETDGTINTKWTERKLKYIADVVGGGTPSKENIEYWGGNIPWVSPKDMHTSEIWDTEDHVTLEAIAESSTQLVEPGAVLVVCRSGILKHTIPCAINKVPVTLNQDMRALIPRSGVSSRYLQNFIVGHQDTLLALWRKAGATVESIEYEYMMNTKVPLPEYAMQEEISDQLGRELERIEAVAATARDTIELLRQRRAALIAAAVTGQLGIGE